MTREDYLKYASFITEKLDNTNEYSLWLAIQCYVDEMYLALECAKVGLKKEKSAKEKSLQALNEIRELVNNADWNAWDNGADTNILIIIDKVLGGNDEKQNNESN